MLKTLIENYKREENYDKQLWETKRCAGKDEYTIIDEDGTVYTLLDFWKKDRIVIAKKEQVNGITFSGMDNRTADTYCQEAGLGYLGTASFYPLNENFFVFEY